MRALSPLIAVMLSSCAAHRSMREPCTAASDPLFDSIASNVRRHTRLPVLLPKKMPDIGQGNQALHAWIKEASASRYSIILSFRGPAGTPCAPEQGPAAADSQVCRFASLFAERASATTCGQGSTIVLADNVRGCVTQPPVGANAGDSRIVWMSGGIRYGATIKAGAEQDLAALANEVIKSRLDTCF